MATLPRFLSGKTATPAGGPTAVPPLAEVVAANAATAAEQAMTEELLAAQRLALAGAQAEFDQLEEEVVTLLVLRTEGHKIKASELDEAVRARDAVAARRDELTRVADALAAKVAGWQADETRRQLAEARAEMCALAAAAPAQEQRLLAVLAELVEAAQALNVAHHRYSALALAASRWSASLRVPREPEREPMRTPELPTSLFRRPDAVLQVGIWLRERRQYHRFGQE